MLIRESITGYKHLDLGNIKLAFTQVCREEIFSDVYFAANSLYYVESGRALLCSPDAEVRVGKGEIALIRQHSKLDIQKFRDENGTDFKSILFFLFPDFVAEFVKREKGLRVPVPVDAAAIIHLGTQQPLTDFCQSLLPLFDKKPPSRSELKEKTFAVLSHLALHNRTLLQFLVANRKPVKIDLYEFMIHVAVNAYSVAELARLTGRSLAAFKRDFCEVFQTTPHQWLLRRRIDRAAQLLTEGKMRPADIYFMLGFKELSHFSAAFKKIKGISPSQV